MYSVRIYVMTHEHKFVVLNEISTQFAIGPETKLKAHFTRTENA